VGVVRPRLRDVVLQEGVVIHLPQHNTTSGRTTISQGRAQGLRLLASCLQTRDHKARLAAGGYKYPTQVQESHLMGHLRVLEVAVHVLHMPRQRLVLVVVGLTTTTTRAHQLLSQSRGVRDHSARHRSTSIETVMFPAPRLVLTRSRMRKTRSKRERRELGRLMFSDMLRRRL
jgi:hypothetical protein